MSKVRFLNVAVDDVTMDEVLSIRSGTIMTLHVDSLARLQKDRPFYDQLCRFDVITCDSQILRWASRFLGQPLKQRVSGSDYFPLFYERYANDPTVTIFLLGALGDIAQRAAKRINERVGREIVVGAFGPDPGFEDDPAELQRIRDMIRASGATVVVVGIGASRQERYLQEERWLLPSVDLWLPLGGTIDYEAGDVVRPPRWITNSGLEWFWRLVREPQRRWRRYLVHQPPVLYQLCMQRLGRYRNPMDPSDPSSFATSRAPVV
jgi:N-acetylglucosaminyldiphosphoundecaprenol N-acetyl-beta-D-mannosaminyltransferase